MTSMPQDFKVKKKISIFSYFWSLLKLYYIIPILISPSGLEKLFNGSWLKFSEKSLWFKWLRHFLVVFFLLNFWFLSVFVVVSIVIRLILMSYWLTMHGKYPLPPTDEQLNIFMDCCSKLLILMAIRTFKKNISRNFFLILTAPKLVFVSCKSVSIVTGPPNFLLKQKSTWLAVPSSNY